MVGVFVMNQGLRGSWREPAKPPFPFLTHKEEAIAANEVRPCALPSLEYNFIYKNLKVREVKHQD